MITEKAPPIFLFYLDEMLTQDEQKRLYELNAKGDLDDSQILEMSELVDKYKSLSKGNPIPVPLIGDLIGMIPDGYKQSMIKTIDMIQNVPTVKGNINSSTITLKSGSNDFINAIMGVANYLFSQNDSLPRVCFFSAEMVVIGGVLLNMTKATRLDSKEQVITMEIQKGDKSFFERFHDRASSKKNITPLNNPHDAGA